MGTGFFPGVKSGRDVTLTPHPLLVQWSRKVRAVHLLPLWAVWPVQSLSACTRVTFTFTLQRFFFLIITHCGMVLFRSLYLRCRKLQLFTMSNPASLFACVSLV